MAKLATVQHPQWDLAIDNFAVNGSLAFHVTAEFRVPAIRFIRKVQTAGVPLLPYNFISDLEKAVAARSDQTGTMLHQITDLFLLHAGHYSAAEVGLYDDVLQMLITKVDVVARATLARRPSHLWMLRQLIQSDHSRSTMPLRWRSPSSLNQKYWMMRLFSIA